MASSNPLNAQHDVSALASACRRNRGYDSARLTPDTWRALANALVLEQNQNRASLIREGENDRSLYFLESGLLRVFSTDKGTRLQLAVIVPGSVVGEGGFFSPSATRSASVEAIEQSTIWKLPPENFDALAARDPDAALALTLYAGSVMRARMLSVAGRLSVV